MTDGRTRVLELFGTEEMKRDVLPRFLEPVTLLHMSVLSRIDVAHRSCSDLSHTGTAAKLVKESVSTESLGSQECIPNLVKIFKTDPIEIPTLGINTDALPSLYPSATRSDNICIHRLKNKIGTHPVPTAEVSLNGAKGYLIGFLNEGIKTISLVLDITRLHSAILSVSSLSRCLQIARRMPRSALFPPMPEVIHSFVISPCIHTPSRKSQCYMDLRT
ncbi:hypothetical protein BS47DRAFT_1389464 [Hydnum rufescens UP504]|uniref:Uncharacterized protein n=1 Tax=Hydnum rufescens UP504 TaxID=1448309 RepID=A0A9P6B5C0_9AGAM|nr:hypothetical protein BS47DRAFT_1389464 [Hydnum rufescens UP504]